MLTLPWVTGPSVRPHRAIWNRRSVIVKKSQWMGHGMALVCVVVWGSTFMVSKGLMTFLQPVQLMLLRFILAYLLLWVLHPKWYFRWREEWRFLLLALFSNTLYCLAETNAITLTQTSNVSILVSTSPIMMALLLAVIRKEEHLKRGQITGYAVAFVGVVLVVLNGMTALHLRPLGDLLALSAAASWSVYSLLLRRWAPLYDGLLITRKLMFYGILTVLPLVLLDGHPIPFESVFTWENGLKLMYLGFVGSALCYLFWNKATQKISVLKASLYIYMVPLVTLVVSAVALHETITVTGVIGIFLVIAGMVLGTL